MPNRPQEWQGLRIPYEASLEDLRAMVAGPVPAKWVAFRALAYRREVEALALLRELAASEDPHVRRAAVETIAGHPDGATLATVIDASLADSDAFVVRTACDAAAALGIASGHTQILSLLTNREPATRGAALRAINVLWKADDFEVVLATFNSDPSEDVRRDAAWVLRAHATAVHRALLFELWRGASLSRYQVWACELAEAFGAAEHVPLLEQLADDADGHVRKAAARALARAEKAG